MELKIWLVYLLAVIGLSLTPGPNSLLVLAHGALHGRVRTLWTIAGGALGFVSLIGLSMLGIGALLQSSAHALTVMKWVGGAYLVWLGIQQWRAPAVPLATQAEVTPIVTARTMIFRAWVINALNPKGTVFLLAVMPQFLNLAEPLLPQYLVIAATLAFTDLVVMAGYTALAARVLRALKSESHLKAMNRVFGGLFVAAGTLLALFKRTA